MLKTFNKKKKNGAGFTLIELLVVISIIGLLVSLVLVSTRGTRGKARDARRITDMQQIFTAQEIVKGEDEQYALIETVGPDPSDVDYSTTTNIASAINKVYLDPFPRDPGGSSSYKGFSNFSDRKKFCVYVEMETAKTGCDPRYFVASGKGVGEVCNTAPTNLDNCGL